MRKYAEISLEETHVGLRPHIHPARARLTVRRRRKVRIVRARDVLYGHLHPVAILATLVEVIGLEVERRLRPAVLVGKVMDPIDDIEGVGAGSVDVVAFGRTDLGVVCIVEGPLRG